MQPRRTPSPPSPAAIHDNVHPPLPSCMRSPTSCLPRRILRVSRFAVLQMSGAPRATTGSRDGLAPGSGFRVVDILAEGVDGDWTPAMHLQIMKVLRWGGRFVSVLLLLLLLKLG